jgi:GTP-binding protein EngB required for normal cell division
MNENHQRHLLVTLRHLDHLLAGAEHALATAGSTSPFAEYTQDSTPVQRQVVHDHLERVRATLLRVLADLELPRPAPVCGALWAARGQITFASIAIAEMEPKRLRGYGALSETDTRKVERAVAELNAALEPLSAFLDQGPAADLQARLDRLEQTREEVRLVRELERVITRHGLVESRGALTRLLDRMENGVFEIGLFGRVSSGKSSFLNHLLGGAVLPVGVTPVTAVPTRVRYGPTPRAVIEFATRKPVQVELDRLAEFATEQQNPGNAKHVARIVVEVLAQRLREGVLFVDTPGLGSLATGGAAETVAYLPRCDLGLVLVDAASALSHEDLALLQALAQAGAQARLLVSKADLLSPADRAQVVAYTERQIADQLGARLGVHALSVVGAEAVLCDRWFTAELEPLLATHRQQAARSVKRKVGALREAVIQALEARRRGPGRPAGAAEAVTGLRSADAWIEAAEIACDKLVNEVPDLGPALITRVANALAEAWQTRVSAPDELAGQCAAALLQAVADTTSSLIERLDDLRRQLEETLAAARRVSGGLPSLGEPLPRPAGLPLFDPGRLLSGTVLRPPWLAVLGLGSLLRRWASVRLQRALGDSLNSWLRQHGQQRRNWLREELAGLRAAFHAQADPLRAALEPPAPDAAGDHPATHLEADLEVLRQWPGEKSGTS